MGNFQGIVLIWNRAYSEFFKGKLLTGIKNENLICFQIISAIVPINVQRHFTFPVFGKK